MLADAVARRDCGCEVGRPAASGAATTAGKKRAEAKKGTGSAGCFAVPVPFAVPHLAAAAEKGTGTAKQQRSQSPFLLDRRYGCVEGRDDGRLAGLLAGRDAGWLEASSPPAGTAESVTSADWCSPLRRNSTCTVLPAGCCATNDTSRSGSIIRHSI